MVNGWNRLGGLGDSGKHVGLKKNTMNALEDMRIERKLIAQYAGSKDNLSAVSDSVLEEMQKNLAREQYSVGGFRSFADW